MASQPAFAHLPPRAAIEAAVETLIAVLDTLDGDPDEENDPFNEGEPAFSAADRALVDAEDEGPGGGWMLDSDYGAEEAGERDEDGRVVPYGVDQTKPISAINPEVR